MSRRVQPYQGACHDPDELWTCVGCERVQCRRCDGIPGDEVLCWECTNPDAPGDAA